MLNGKLEAAVIGLGEGFRHIKAYQENSNYQLTAICDPLPEQIERRRGEYQLSSDIFSCEDYREIVKRKNIDVVSVCSPDYFHAEQSIACLEAGKHVLCEKPMTLDLQEAAAIVEAARKSGRSFMIAHPTRYTPAFILAKKIIARGDIGELFMAETEYAHNYRRVGGQNGWRKDTRRDPLLGGGCHAVDLLRWAVDDLIDEAFAYGTKKGLADWPIDYDSYFCLYKFKGGVIGKVMCSIGLSRPYTMRSVFYGTKGTIICDSLSSAVQLSSVPFYGVDTDQTEFISIPVEVKNHNVDAQVQLLAEIVLHGANNSANAVEGARTVAACCAAIESAHSGKPVKVQNDF
jgi:UDP-N-acetylglucosamine 3-dehydrogenase